jgi:DNA-binding IclR family transcriptional regulator
MTRSLREITLTRLVSEHPAWTLAQLAYAATLSEEQAGTTLATLTARGVVEAHGGGYRRRRSDVRAWRSDAVR